MHENKLPVGWQRQPLSDLADVQTGIAKGKEVNGKSASLPYLRVANVQDGHVDLSVIKEITVAATQVERYSLKTNDVLFTEGGDYDKLGRGTVWKGQIRPCLHQNHVFAVRVRPGELAPEFLAHQASSEYGRRYFQLSSKQSTNLASINSTQLKAFPILKPPLSEQLKIVDILRTWDEAIEACERQRKAKLNALTAARQKVFGLDGSPPSRWPSAKLDAVVERVRRLADGSDHPVMTISGKSGFKRQDEKFDRFMAGESVNRYLLLMRDEFAYNKGNSKTYPQGCIYRLEQDTALVPFVYFAFALRGDLNSDFYRHLFEAGFLNHQLARLINSGVRNDGLLNIYADDFFGCVVPVPPKPEQERIAAFFNLAKQELAALDRKIDALRLQKRGLMQKLLTGEWRMTADA